MLARRRCTAVLVLSLVLLPVFASAGPRTPGAVPAGGFLSSWLGRLAGGWGALTGSGETTPGALWAPSGVGVDPNGRDGGTQERTTDTSPTPTAQDGSTSTAQEQ